jgi:TolB-like protein/Flp pilus assembly protein TadD
MWLMGSRSAASLWAELRRRRVPQATAYYVAAAWVVAQAASLLLDAFELGHYMRYVIAALAAALPLVVILAWRFDVTTHGIVRTLAPAAPGPAEPPAALAAPAPERSIAVLPLANLSEDPANEYFSDGLAEEIRNQLARVPGLRVAARRSSFAFKGRNEDVREIGRRLNVATLLEGGVRKHADTVRIDVQLVSTTDGYHLWSQSFERRLDDVFRLQTEIASAVIAAVSARHGLAEWTLPPPEARTFDVYNAYLLGRHHFHKRSEPSLRKAAECFEQAIHLDPQYALAYSGLSDTHMLLSVRYYGTSTSEEAVARALPFARRALELAPELAEAHASLGLIELNRGDAAEAGRLLQRAMRLNPGYTMAHVWYGLTLTAQGRYREAAAHNREAFRLDPLSPIVNANVGFDEWRFGNVAEAEARFRAAIEIDPAFAVPCSGMAKLSARQDDIDAALRWVDRAIDLAPRRAFNRSRKALILMQAGDTESALACAEEADRVGPTGTLNPELRAALLIAAGDREALARIVRGDDRASTSALARAQAHIALGEFDAAWEIHERSPTSPRHEIDELLNDDWTWRFPHSVYRGHLRLHHGDERGRADLARVLTEVERAVAQGIVSADLSYWAASALAVLGRSDEARQQLAAARRQGWRHEWWQRVDWNLRALG